MPNLEQSDAIRGEVAEDVQLGPFCVVAEGARVGAGTRLGAHVVVHPGTSIGESCEVQDNVVLGKPPKLARHSSAAGAPIEPLVIDNTRSSAPARSSGRSWPPVRSSRATSRHAAW